MTENNTFLDIIGNCEPISILRNGKNTLDCIVNSKDENGITTEYTLFFDKDKISIRNNFTGVFFRDQDYSFNILATIINDIITNTSSYEENVPYYERSEKAQLKNLIARMIFKNIDERSYIDDFKYYMNNTGNINSKYYPILFKICCEAGKYEFVKNLYAIFRYSKEEQLFKNDEEITAAACFGGNPEIVRLLESEGFYFGELSLERAFVSGNFKIFDCFFTGNLRTNIIIENEKISMLINRFVLANDYNNLERFLYYSCEETEESYLDRKEKDLLTEEKILAEQERIQLKIDKLTVISKDLNMELLECDELSKEYKFLKEQENILLGMIKELEERKEELDIIKDNFLNIDVNIKDNYGNTPLILAAYKGHTEIVQLLLLQPGIDINAKAFNGFTPLIWAALKGHTEIARLLLSHPNTDVNIKDNQGNTPLILAVRDGRTEIFRLLLSRPGIDVNARNNDGFAPLICAALYRRTEMVQLLLSQQGIDVNVKDNYGNTPLIQAAESGCVEIFQLLLSQRGIEINVKGIYGNTPLHCAAANGRTEIFRLLLPKQGIEEINARNNWGNTPLICAAGSGYTETVQLLLSQPGIDANVKNYNGDTPLIYAAVNGHKKIVQLLLSQPGIDIPERYLCRIKELIGGQEEFDRYAEIRRQKEAERERNNQTPNNNLANAIAGFKSKFKDNPCLLI